MRRHEAPLLSPAIRLCQSYEGGGFSSVGPQSYVWDTLHFEHFVRCFSNDERPRIGCLVYSTTPHQKDMSVNSSETLTGDRSPRAPFRDASLHRGKLERSQDCRNFSQNWTSTGTSHTPSNGYEHPYHRLVGTACAPGNPKIYRNGVISLYCSPWRGPLKDRVISTQFPTISNGSLTIMTRIRLCITHVEASCQFPHTQQ